MRNLLMGFGIALMMATQIACAPQNFKADSASTTPGNVEAAGEVGNVTSEPTPTEPAIDPGTSVILPEAYFKITLCQADTKCVVDALLKKSESKSVSFQWHTADTRYMDPTLSNEARARTAIPNQHYVPIGGTVTWSPGQTLQKMHIQALNGFTTIDIPFNFWDCRYNNLPISCKVMFPAYF